MKRILILVVLILAAFVAQAQNRAFGELFSRYSGREGYTTVELGDKMMQMMSQRASRGDRQLAELLGDIRLIRIISTKQADENLAQAVVAIAQRGGFKLIMSQNESGQLSRFYLIDRSSRGADSEFLMLSDGAQELIAVYIYGTFDVKDISRLSAIRPN